MDCEYKSGFTVGTNIGARQLRARVFAGALYMCGGVSKSDGSAFTQNTELVVATLPSNILAAWKNGYTGITLNARAASVGQQSRAILWSVAGSVESSNEGNIVMNVISGTNAPQSAAWAQAAPCLGLCPYQG